MNLNDQLKETGEDIKEELAKVKNWPVVTWLGKWFGLILVAVIVILFVIIVAGAGLKYSTKNVCVEASMVDKSMQGKALEICKAKQDGELLYKFIDEFPERVPKEYDINSFIETLGIGKK